MIRASAVWRSRRFGRNVLILGGGTIAAQAVNAIVAPVLARLYDPSEFSVLALFAAAVTTLATVVTLRYDFAIVLPRSERQASELIFVAMMSAAGMSILVSAVCILFPLEIAALLGDDALARWLPWLGFSTASVGIFQSLSYAATRMRRFGDITLARLAQSVTTASVQVASGLLGASSIGLVSGLILGQAVSSVVLIGRGVGRGMRILSGHSASRLLALAKRYSDFPKYNAPKGLMNALSMNLPLVIFAYYFSPVSVGCYAFIHRVLKVPMSLVSQSLRPVFYELAAKEAREPTQMRNTLRRITFYLFVVSVPATVLGLVLLPLGVDRFLGPDWRMAGIYGQILAPFLMISVVNVPSTSAIPILRAQRFFLWYEVALTVARCGSMVIGGILESDMIAVGLYSAAGLVFNGLLVILVDRQVGRAVGA